MAKGGTEVVGTMLQRDGTLMEATQARNHFTAARFQTIWRGLKHNTTLLPM